MSEGCERCERTPGWEPVEVERGHAVAALRLLDGGARRRALGAAGVPGRAVVDVAEHGRQPARARRGAGVSAGGRRRAGPVRVRPGGHGQDAAGVHGASTRRGRRASGRRRSSGCRCCSTGSSRTGRRPTEPRRSTGSWPRSCWFSTTSAPSGDAATDYTRRTLLMLYEARHDAGSAAPSGRRTRRRARSARSWRTTGSRAASRAVAGWSGWRAGTGGWGAAARIGRPGARALRRDARRRRWRGRDDGADAGRGAGTRRNARRGRVRAGSGPAAAPRP